LIKRQSTAAVPSPASSMRHKHLRANTVSPEKKAPIQTVNIGIDCCLLPVVTQEMPIGSIVSINGVDFGAAIFTERKTAITFLAVLKTRKSMIAKR